MEIVDNPEEIIGWAPRYAEDYMANVLQMLVMSAEEGNEIRVRHWGEIAMRVFRKVNSRWRSVQD